MNCHRGPVRRLDVKLDIPSLSEQSKGIDHSCWEEFSVASKTDEALPTHLSSRVWVLVTASPYNKTSPNRGPDGNVALCNSAKKIEASKRGVNVVEGGPSVQMQISFMSFLCSSESEVPGRRRAACSSASAEDG